MSTVETTCILCSSSETDGGMHGSKQVKGKLYQYYLCPACCQKAPRVYSSTMHASEREGFWQEVEKALVS